MKVSKMKKGNYLKTVTGNLYFNGWRCIEYKNNKGELIKKKTDVELLEYKTGELFYQDLRVRIFNVGYNREYSTLNLSVEYYTKDVNGNVFFRKRTDEYQIKEEEDKRKHKKKAMLTSRLQKFSTELIPIKKEPSLFND